MHIILMRHGATGHEGKFIKGRQDHHLNSEGGAQAEAAAKGLLAMGVKPLVVVSGPLARQQRTAEIVMENIGIPGEPIVDERLNEIDSTPWAGKTTEEIANQYGADVLAGWQQRSEIPAAFEFSEADCINTARDFAEDCAKFVTQPEDTILAVTSTGFARFFLQVVGKEAWQHEHNTENHRLKLCHMGKISKEDGTWQLDYWNVDSAASRPIQTSFTTQKKMNPKPDIKGELA